MVVNFPYRGVRGLRKYGNPESVTEHIWMSMPHTTLRLLYSVTIFFGKKLLGNRIHRLLNIQTPTTYKDKDSSISIEGIMKGIKIEH